MEGLIMEFIIGGSIMLIAIVFFSFTGLKATANNRVLKKEVEEIEYMIVKSKWNSFDCDRVLKKNRKNEKTK